MSKESFSEFLRSKLFAGIVAGVCIMLAVICVFEAGVMVGYHEASFTSRWGENYGNNFGGPGTMMGLGDSHTPMPNGVSGKILSISTVGSTTTLVISSTQNPEEKILLGSDTVIRDHENTITASSLSAGSYAVVLGTPNNQGEIEAKLVRIVPAPMMNGMMENSGATSTQP